MPTSVPDVTVALDTRPLARDLARAAGLLEDLRDAARLRKVARNLGWARSPGFFVRLGWRRWKAMVRHMRGD